MAISLHYTAKDVKSLALKSQLVAFRQLEGSHTGENVGKIFVQVLKDDGCLHKMSMITCDNNNTKMVQIQELTAAGMTDFPG
ncbi:hypothetical protein FB451DRAFT_1394382 [Mycena latifolia]|nr:hypothetical protein FB451DRAFT_1394382 [Mycena latifolia]